MLITSSMTRHYSLHLTHTLATTRHSACAVSISDLTHRPTGAQLAECSRVAVSTDTIFIAPRVSRHRRSIHRSRWQGSMHRCHRLSMARQSTFIDGASHRPTAVDSRPMGFDASTTVSMCPCACVLADLAYTALPHPCLSLTSPRTLILRQSLSFRLHSLRPSLLSPSPVNCPLLFPFSPSPRWPLPLPPSSRLTATTPPRSPRDSHRPHCPLELRSLHRHHQYQAPSHASSPTPASLPCGTTSLRARHTTAA